MADMMTFPDTWEEFEKIYGFDDSEEVYTNGSREEQMSGCPLVELPEDVPNTNVSDILPSAVPKRTTGKWILVNDRNGQHFVCIHCGEWRYHQDQRFCGHCGSYNRGEEDEMH